MPSSGIHQLVRSSIHIHTHRIDRVSSLGWDEPKKIKPLDMGVNLTIDCGCILIQACILGSEEINILVMGLWTDREYWIIIMHPNKNNYPSKFLRLKEVLCRASRCRRPLIWGFRVPCWHSPPVGTAIILTYSPCIRYSRYWEVLVNAETSRHLRRIREASPGTMSRSGR